MSFQCKHEFLSYKPWISPALKTTCPLMLNTGFTMTPSNFQKLGAEDGTLTSLCRWIRPTAERAPVPWQPLAGGGGHNQTAVSSYV